MVAYTDVPEVNALYAEQAKIDSALNMLDNGGTLAMFTIAPAPPPPDQVPMMLDMPVQLTTVAPSPALMTEIRNAMVTRYNEITSDLGALGVTGSPPPAL
jgi:hypothetical protein